MTGYFIRRFLLVVPTFLGITLLVFTIMQLVPGGPLEQELLKLQAGMMAGETSGGTSDATGGIEIPPDALAEMRRFYGFDKPLPVRYLRWLGLWPREMDPVTLTPGEWKKVERGVKARALPVAERQGEYRLEWDLTELSQRWEIAGVAPPSAGARDSTVIVAWLKFKGVHVRNRVDSTTLAPGVWTELPGRVRAKADFAAGEGWRLALDTSEVPRRWQITEVAPPDSAAKQSEPRITVAWTRFSGLFTGDLGRSYVYAEPVSQVIAKRFPVSIYFGLIGFMLSYLVCVPLGVFKAIKHTSRFDMATSALVFLGYSIPGWALGAVLLVLFGGGSFWNVFPLGEFRSAGWEQLSRWAKILDQLHHTILPVTAYMVGSFATLTVVMKNSLLENLGQDYVRTAFAKGLSERRVVFVHALRNSLIPIATGLGHLLSLVLAGSYLIEKVFNIQGFGLLGFTSIIRRDYPVVLGILVISSLLRLFGNIFSDILYAVIDPRIRFK